MGIRGILLAISFLYAVTTAQAVTNSWKYGSSDYWDVDGDWSNGHPTISDAADVITNGTSKTVTIDANDVTYDDFVIIPSTLTVSNVVVGGKTGTTNTLALTSMNDGTNLLSNMTLPLHVVNSVIITNAGVLQVTNSMLDVDGLLQIDGTMSILAGADLLVSSATFSTNAVLRYALGSNNGTVTVNNGLTLGGTLNIVDGGGLTNATYTIMTYGGALTYNGLSIGSAPSNFVFTVSTNTPGQINVVVSSGSVSSNITAAITSIQVVGTDVVVTVTSQVGATYQLQYSESLTPTNWLDVAGASAAGTGGPLALTDVGGALQPQRFYRVAVTGGGSGEQPLAKIDSIQIVGSDMVISITAIASDTYQLQSSPSMTPTNWMNVGSPTNGVTGTLQLTDPGGALGDFKFYRVLISY